MSELVRTLERESETVDLVPGAFERMLRRRDRKRRNQRIGTAVVALVIGAVAVSAVVGGFRAGEPRPSRPGSITPDNVAKLRLLWSAQLPAMQGSPDGLGISAAEGTVFVPDQKDHRLYAFPEDCTTAGAQCDPTWGSPPLGAFEWMPDGPAIADGRVFVNAGDSLWAFPVDCGSDGFVCRPSWHASLHGAGVFNQPVVSGGVVYAATSTGRMEAFPVDCGSDNAICESAWTSAPQRAALATGTVDGGIVYAADFASKGQPHHDRVYAFSASCVDGCDPEWVGKVPQDFASTPVVADGLLYVGTAPDGTVRAYPVGCGLAPGCRPAWVGTDAHIVNLPHPTVGDGIVVVSSSYDHLVRAFPARCSAACDPLWTAFPLGISQNAVLVRDGLVWAPSMSDGVVAYRAACGTGRALCQPAWTSAAGATGAGIGAVALDHGLVFGANPITGEVVAFAPS